MTSHHRRSPLAAPPARRRSLFVLGLALLTLMACTRAAPPTASGPTERGEAAADGTGSDAEAASEHLAEAQRGDAAAADPSEGDPAAPTPDILGAEGAGEVALVDPERFDPLPSIARFEAAERNLHAEELQAMAIENAGFALRLQHAVAQADPDAPNIVLSSWSIRSAFALLFSGSRGETADELAEGLGFGMEPARFYAAMRRVTGALDERTRIETPEGVDPPALTIVNDLWTQEGYPLNEAWTELLIRAWDATVRTRDFIGAYDEARRNINTYIQAQTRDRIRDLLPDGSLSSDTRLVLTNAIWFRAGWQHVFDPAHTRDAAFLTRAGERVTVPTMNAQASFPSAAVEGHVLVELPHVGGDLGLVLLLPDEGRLEHLEANLEADTLFEWMSELRARGPVRLSLPKFETRTSIDLIRLLSEAGVHRVFVADEADLSGLSPRAIEDGLHVSGAFHQAFIAVDEEGAEAAGATAIAVATRAMPAEPLVVRFDRPFLFFVRDRPTGTILFSGRIGDPR